MPANYCDMLVPHSPPIFSHSPPTGYHLAEYNSGYNRHYDPLRGFCRPQMTQSLQNRKPLTLQINNLPVSPKKSCLAHRSDSAPALMGPLASPDSDGSSPNSPTTKTKKKVVFADDQGLSLTEIRIMTEPSNVPPHWTLQYLAHITQGLVSPVPNEHWTVDFKQPASDYLAFRQRLDKYKVSLENVIVRENESVVVGTVKVKNLDFQKEVIVRASWDNWKSQEDIFCTFSQYFQINGTSGAHVLYDTFSFKITLPPASSKLEFCVCFRCENQEYWDNNDGQNYSLSKRSTGLDGNHLLSSMNKLNLNGDRDKQNSNRSSNIKPSSPIAIPRYQDATQAKVTSWSEFAAWNHLENNCPYW